MKNDPLGFGFIALGSFLYAVNFLAAVIHMPALTSWEGGLNDRLRGAYAIVGRQPMLLGAVFFIIGVALILTRARRQAIGEWYRGLGDDAPAPQTPSKASEPTP